VRSRRPFPYLSSHPAAPAVQNTFHEVFTRTEVESALAAGIFHRREVPIGAVKDYLKGKVEIRSQRP